jgi:hypothetical protein
LTKSPGKKQLDTSSSIVSDLHIKAFDLVGSNSKERPARIGNDWHIKKKSDKKCIFKFRRKLKDFHTTRTVGSVDTESVSDGKNTITDVSEKMLAKHLKNRFKYGDVFNQAMQAET